MTHERQVTRESDVRDYQLVSNTLRSLGLVHRVPMNEAWIVTDDDGRSHLEVNTFTDPYLAVCTSNPEPHSVNASCHADDDSMAFARNADRLVIPFPEHLVIPLH